MSEVESILDSPSITTQELAGALYNELSRRGIVVRRVQYHTDGSWKLLLRSRWGVLGGGACVEFRNQDSSLWVAARHLLRHIRPERLYLGKPHFNPDDVSQIVTHLYSRLGQSI